MTELVVFKCPSKIVRYKSFVIRIVLHNAETTFRVEYEDIANHLRKKLLSKNESLESVHLKLYDIYPD